MKDIKSIFKYAMGIELQGIEFYQENATKLSNVTGKAIFEELVDTEKEHYEFLKEELEHYEMTGSIKATKEDLLKRMRMERNMFEEREKSEHLKETIVESDIPDITILKMAYLIEKDAVDFYNRVATEAEDEQLKNIFEMLASWEQGHAALFKKEYQKRMEEYMRTPWGG